MCVCVCVCVYIYILPPPHLSAMPHSLGDRVKTAAVALAQMTAKASRSEMRERILDRPVDMMSITGKSMILTVVKLL